MDILLKQLERLLSIANKETDDEEVKRHKGFLVYMGLLMSLGGLIWGTLCLINELFLAASIPFIYIAITTLNFSYLYKTKNFNISKNIQIFISLILPFFFQFFLGGFVASGGNVLWSVLAVFGSFTLRNKYASVVWLVLFIFIMILSGFVDTYAQRYSSGLSETFTTSFFVMNFIMTISVVFTLYYYFVSSEEKAKNDLRMSLEQLELAQEKLIASEKMASLGSLVSGVAHEINTPLGVGLTGISQIDHEAKKMKANYNSESLTEEALLESIATIEKLTQTIRDRLTNAVTLVKSFKSTSVDQHFEDKREFILEKYLQDLMLGLQNLLKSKDVKINLSIDKEIVLDSYPGIFSQVITNLVVNSIKHGFQEGLGNEITISVVVEDDILIRYEDNGSGVTEDVQKKIFDPFFTTKRGQGGSGLGMNIVYNLVTQKLGGVIDIINIKPHGLGFEIRLSSSHIRRQ